MPAAGCGGIDGQIVSEVVPVLLTGEMADDHAGQGRALEGAAGVGIGERPQFKRERAGDVGGIAWVFERGDVELDYFADELVADFAGEAWLGKAFRVVEEGDVMRLVRPDGRFCYEHEV